MKKFTAILVAIVIALFVVSCGGSSSKDKDKPDTGDTGDTTDTTDTTDTADTADTADSTDTTDTADTSDTGDTGTVCKIDESYESTDFDNYYTFKGAGVINDENANSVDYTTMTKTSLYLEEQKDYNLKQSQSYILNATLTNGMKSVVVIGMGYGAQYANLQIQAIIPDQWFQAMDQLLEEYPDDFDRAPFAPMVNAASLDLHVKGQNIDWYKICTIAINTYAPTQVSEGDMPEGSFQYCYGKEGTIDAGQTIKLGIDARLTAKFEDIQAAYNEGLEEGDEGYVKTPADLCTCISFANGNGEEIECPTDDDTGDSDTGDSDTGDSDTGDSDTGDSDTGDSDTGDSDTGDSDTGDSDTGDSDTGDSDTGDSDTGDSDTGDSDTGDSDTGDSDTGDSDNSCTTNDDCGENEVCNEGTCQAA